jgi:hypothetical protein
MKMYQLDVEMARLRVEELRQNHMKEACLRRAVAEARLVEKSAGKGEKSVVSLLQKLMRRLRRLPAYELHGVSSQVSQVLE